MSAGSCTSTSRSNFPGRSSASRSTRLQTVTRGFSPKPARSLSATSRATSFRPPESFRNTVYLIGLTGGIASGKSTIARRLAEHGAVHIDADQLAREAVEPGTRALGEIVDRFGAGILSADGSLDRP